MNVFKDFKAISLGHYVNPAVTEKNTFKQLNNSNMKKTAFALTKATTEKKHLCTFTEEKTIFKLDQKVLFTLLFIVPVIAAAIIEILTA